MFTMQLITFSPSKHHAKNVLFLKHPSKTPAKTKKPRIEACSIRGKFFPAKI